MNDSISEEAHEAASLELLEEITARSHPIGYHVQAAIDAATKRLRKALEDLTHCNLTDENCASLEVASRRVRNMANRALQPHTVTEATMVKALIPDNEDAIQILAAIARANARAKP